jgi:hypothetical protein
MSDLLKQQYSILSQLRSLDEKVFRIQKDIDRIPQVVGKIKTELEGLNAEFKKYEDQYKTNEKKLRSCESDLKDREMKLEKAQGKLMDVRSNEEFQAAQREIAAQKQVKSAIEDQILEMLNFLDREGKNYQDKKQANEAAQAKTQSDLEQIERDIDKFRGEREQLEKQRAALVVELQPEIAALYQRGYQQNRGSGIAVADRGKCLGCNMQIRAQVYNEILGFRQTHRCSHCGRVLILQSGEDAANAAAQNQEIIHS